MTLHLSGHADSTICSAPPTGHGTTDEWNGFSLGAGAPCELSSLPRGNTQFYHSHLKEPSTKVYQIQQSEERVYNSLLTVLGHGWLAHPQWCAPLCFSGPKLHSPTFPFQGPSPALFYFLLFSTLQLHSSTWDLWWPDSESPSFSRVCSSIPSKVC